MKEWESRRMFHVTFYFLFRGEQGRYYEIQFLKVGVEPISYICVTIVPRAPLQHARDH